MNRYNPESNSNVLIMNNRMFSLIEDLGVTDVVLCNDVVNVVDA